MRLIAATTCALTRLSCCAASGHAAPLRLEYSNSHVFSRRVSPELCPARPALCALRAQGNAGRPMRPIAPRGAMVGIVETHHAVSQVTTGKRPGIPPPAMVPTGLYVISPVIGLLTPSLAKRSRQFDASAEASGPHDFAVRIKRHSSKAPPASTASRLTSVTIAKRPSERDGTAGINKAVSTRASSTISENQKLREFGPEIGAEKNHALRRRFMLVSRRYSMMGSFQAGRRGTMAIGLKV